jgi:hypothetical protein
MEDELKRVVVATAGAVVVGLAACSHATAPATAAGSHGTSSARGNGGSSVPVSCSQRYQVWVNGAGKGLLVTLHALSAADAAGDSQALTVALNKARPAVAGAALDPVPACADPRGYWNVLLMHVSAAAGGKGSAPGVRAALKDVPAIERELTAELNGASR